MSPLIDSYTQLNEPHAHPKGMMSILNNSHLQSNIHTNASTQQIFDTPMDNISYLQDTPGESGSRLPGKTNLASVLKLDRVFPINIHYQHSTSQFDLEPIQKAQKNSNLTKVHTK